jgi:hypothetical protein
LCQVGYEQLAREPERELARLFAFLDLENEPNAVNYGDHATQALTAGRGDPHTVHTQRRPVDTSIAKWVHELAADPEKRAVATEIAAGLDADDVKLWGFERDQLLQPLAAAALAPQTKTPKQTGKRSYLLQRRIMLALKKDIRTRPHGKVVERVRYYCNVLLRE